MSSGNHTANALDSLHILSDYPLLASIATQVTKATKLDGRACRHLYMTAALHNVLWDEASPREQELMTVLGVVAKT